MNASRARPTRFRSRLTAAFILVAGVTSGLLALAGYIVVREYRDHTFTERAERESTLAMLSAPRDLSLDDFEEVLGEFQQRAGFESVAVVDDATFSSSPERSAEDVPDVLRADLDAGELHSATATIDGTPYVVVAGAPPRGGSSLYFFFDRSDVTDSLRSFRDVLAIGWVIAVLAATAVGGLVARRTLRPVREAAGAAQSLAEGLLHTRLPAASDDEFGLWEGSFNRMAAALEDTIGELSRAAERERRFTADVAHELRTPLTGMTSAAGLLEEELSGLSDTGHRMASLLIEDVRRLQALVLELLDLARVDAGHERVDLEPLSLVDAIPAVLHPWDGERTMRTRVPADAVVLGDRARFRRVLGNLVANALQHGGGQAEVVVRREESAEDETIAIDVLDRGPGIPDEEPDRLFDRFYKGDASRSLSGSGLGLSIAYEYARLQGGSLEAANREGGGARFTFRLPAAPSDRAVPAAPPRSAGAPTP